MTRDSRPPSVNAFEFLESRYTGPCQAVYVLAGEERLLKTEALERIRHLALGTAEADYALSSYSGDDVTLADVRAELETLPFLAPRRLVVIRDADAFVTRYREGLENYFQRPSPHGVLVLDVKSWRSNTRLAKLLPAQGLVECSVPEYQAGQRQVRAWLMQRAGTRHGKKLQPQAADRLLLYHGLDLGILDQELAKLAVYVGEAGEISPEAVQTLSGRSREAEVWPILDLLSRGDRAGSLRLLGQLLDQGNEPLQVLGAFSWHLRRLAQVHRLRQQGLSVLAAAKQAGLHRADQAEQLLSRLGPRADRLYDWLLDADLRLKSSNDLPPRAVLERLVVRLAS